MFEEGDKVKCVRSENFPTKLTIDKVYVTTKDDAKRFTYITNDKGEKNSYYTDRFVKVNEISERKESVMKIYNVVKVERDSDGELTKIISSELILADSLSKAILNADRKLKPAPNQEVLAQKTSFTAMP